MRIGKFCMIAWVGIGLLGSGCATQKEPVKANFALLGDSDQDATTHITQQALQNSLLRFVSRFGNSINIPLRRIVDSGNQNSRVQALRQLLVYNSTAVDIVMGPVPEVNLLDLYTFVYLCRDAVEKYWIPKVYGKQGKPIEAAFDQAMVDLRSIVNVLLDVQQQAKLQQIVRTWRAKHPDQVDVETIRISDFTQPSGDGEDRLAQESRGLLSGVSAAAASVDHAVLFSERALFYAQRLPFLLRIQTRLLSYELSGDQGSLVQQMQATLQHANNVVEKMHGLSFDKMNSVLTHLDSLLESDSRLNWILVRFVLAGLILFGAIVALYFALKLRFVRKAAEVLAVEEALRKETDVYRVGLRVGNLEKRAEKFRTKSDNQKS